MQLFKDIMGAMFQLPKIVFLWVNLMSVVFMAAFVLAIIHPDRFFNIAAGAMVLGMGPNVFLMLRDRGLSKLMSISHLPAWIPFYGWLTYRIAEPNSLLDGDPWVATYALTLAAVMGLCLALDVLEAVRWIGGDREIMRAPATVARLAA